MNSKSAKRKWLSTRTGWTLLDHRGPNTGSESYISGLNSIGQQFHEAGGDDRVKNQILTLLQRAPKNGGGRTHLRRRNRHLSRARQSFDVLTFNASDFTALGKNFAVVIPGS